MERMQAMHIDVSWRTLVRVTIFGFSLWAIWQLGNVLTSLLFAVVVASAIDPIAKWLARWGVPRVMAVILFFLSFFGLLALAAYLVVPILVNELYIFLTRFPDYAQAFLKSFPDILNFLPFINTEDINQLFREGIITRLGNVPQNFVELLAGIFGGFTSFVVILVVSFYLSLQERGVEKFLRLVTPLEHESYVLDLWARTKIKIGYWFQGQILLMLLVGLLTYAGLAILGIPYAFSLGALMGILEIIPFAGPVIAAIPGVILGFIENPALGLLVLFLYVIIQQLENHVLYPVVMQKALGVNPLAVIIALVVGIKLGGFIGLLLAVPMAVALLEYLSDMEKNKHEVRGGGIQ